MLIIAGPGSGKTEVISQRAANLVSSGKATPENLLVTTFTEKAALELKDRIQSKLPNKNVEIMQISTIHSLCHTLLNEFRSSGPFPKGFWVLDEATQLLLIYSRRKQLGLEKIMKGRESDFYASVLRMFNLATEELVDPQKLISFYESQFNHADEDNRTLWEESLRIAQAYARYLNLLMERNATDFSNLQAHTLRMLQKNPYILKQLQDRYTDILIDEYQDTNTIQEMILSQIAEPEMNISVVGDDDQSIYRFRGATTKNILNFSDKYRPEKEIKLEDNFRSLEPIINHSSRLINCNFSPLHKELRCNRAEWENDILYVHEESSSEEADSVIAILTRLKADGTIQQYNDVAILLRSVRSYAEPYIEALKRYKIPFVVTRDGGFFNRQDISEICNLFTFIGASKPWGDRFIRCSMLQLEKETEQKLKQYKEDLMSLDGEKALKSLGISSKKDREIILGLIDLKKRVQQRKNQSILEILYEILQISGYFNRIESGKKNGAIRNIGILTKIIRDFDEYRGTNNIYSFLSYIKLLKQSSPDSFIEPLEDAVQVMTVHQAKGLEFPVVVIGAVMEGRFPTRKRKEKYEIPHTMRKSGQPEVDDPHIIDERKLFYVGASRARDLLIIGTSNVVNKRGGGPSRFINECLGKNLEGARQRSKMALDSAIKVAPFNKHMDNPRLRISYSQLAYYLQCPVRFKYYVIDGLNPPILVYFYFGASVHRALESIHSDIIAGKIIDKKDIEDYVEKNWLMSEKMKGEKEKHYKEAAANQIGNYLEKAQPSSSDLYKAEESFAFSLKDVVIEGKIDLIRNMNGDIKEIVDFKTTHSKTIPIEQTHLQMDIYALGAERSLTLNVGNRTLYFLKDNNPEIKGWDQEKRRKAESTLCELLEKIKRQEFKPRVTFCLYCEEFKNICPYVQQ